MNNIAKTKMEGVILGKGERLIYILFFISGFPALFYQLIWQRSLFRIFGVNAESVTVVVMAFMLGLGVGSLAGAFLARLKTFPPLLALGVIEICVGIFGIFSLKLFEMVGRVVLGLPLSMTACVVLGLLVIPTALMGATLPILVAYFAPRLRNMGASVGSLYYVNTLGAGASCFVASFALFPFFGMQTTVFLGAAINIGIGMSALAYFFSDGGSSAEEESSGSSTPPVPSEPLLIDFRFVLLLSALEGFISLSYEIFFFRIISFMMGSITYAFSFTLGFFLLGLAQGANHADWLSRKLPHAQLAAKMVRSLALAVALGFLFLPILYAIGNLNIGKSKTGVALSALFMDLVAFMLVLYTAKAWGVFLPSLIELGVLPDKKSGARTGLVYVSNIVGAVCGSGLTGFFLTDYLGLRGIASALVIFGLCFLLLFWLSFQQKSAYKNIFAAVAAVMLMALLVPVGETRLMPDLFSHIQKVGSGLVAEAVENRHGIITVDSDGAVFGNGMLDGHFNIDLVHDTNGIFRPFALSLFHSAPHDVLMIGLSSGSWAQVIANDPDVKSLTILEINPGYLKLIGERPAYASLLSDPKVTIIIDDGRRWLNLHPGRKFDAIVANAIIHFRSNATNLLSQEFLELLRMHLNKGGVAFYNTTDSLRAQRTACLVFPYGIRFTNHMLVSDSPLNLDFDRWRRVLIGYKINGAKVLNVSAREDVDHLDALMNMKHVYDSLDIFDDQSKKPLEACSSILARSGNLKPDTDDNMGTEWRYGFFKGE